MNLLRFSSAFGISLSAITVCISLVLTFPSELVSALHSQSLKPALRTNICEFLSNPTSGAVWTNSFVNISILVSVYCKGSEFSIYMDEQKLETNYVVLQTNASFLTVRLKLNATKNLQDKDLQIVTYTRPNGGNRISRNFSLVVQEEAGYVSNIICGFSCGQSLYCKWDPPQLPFPLSVKYNLTVSTLDNMYTSSHLLKKTNFLTNSTSIVQPEKEYIVRVSTVSPVGEGHPMETNVTTSFVPNVSTAFIWITMSNQSNEANLIIKGTVAEADCLPSYPTVFNVLQLSCSSNTSFSKSVTVTNGSISFTIKNILANQAKCSIDYNWGNSLKRSPIEHYSFRTTIIQNFTAVVKNNSIELTCLFANNSLAQSCVINVYNSLSGELWANFTITKDPRLSYSSMNVSSLPSGNFTLTCTAVMPDGTKHPSHMNQTITISSPSTPEKSRIICGLLIVLVVLLLLVACVCYVPKHRKRTKPCLKQFKGNGNSLRLHDSSPPQQSPTQSPSHDQPRTPSPVELNVPSTPIDQTALEMASPQPEEHTTSFTASPISTTENENRPLLRIQRKGNRLDSLDLRKVSQSPGGSIFYGVQQGTSPKLPSDSVYSKPNSAISPVSKMRTVFSFDKEAKSTYVSIPHDPPYEISQQPLDCDEQNSEIVISKP